MTFDDVKNQKNIYLYLGDYVNTVRFNNIPFIGISIRKNDSRHIKHNIINPFPLQTNSVDIIQSEDVIEHLKYSDVLNHINEMYRILKPDGLFRLSMPDYRCDILINRSQKDKTGNIIFDPAAGGHYDKNLKEVIGKGHKWFPTYELILDLFQKSYFSKNKINFLHYYTNTEQITNQIDYSKGYIQRTPDNDKRVQDPYRPLSIVIDAYK